MNNKFIANISDKNEYVTVMEAVTGTKRSFTDAEKEKLRQIYINEAETNFGFANEELVKLLLVLDTAQDKTDPAGSPMADGLDKTSLDALGILAALHGSRIKKPELALAAKTAALNGDVSELLALALARAALDTLSVQQDIAAYREDINGLIELLNRADNEMFQQASMFLHHVRNR